MITVEEDSEPWQGFTEVQFQGDAACLGPDDYLNVNAMGLKSVVKSLRSSPSKLRIYLPHGASSFVV